MSYFTHGYALIIGIADYPYVRKLPQSVLKDAEDIRNLLSSEHYCGYPATNVKVLLNEHATGQNIRQELAWLVDTVTPEDTVLFYFSGHGAQIEDGVGADNYLVPYDCNFTDFTNTAISSAEFTQLLHRLQVQKLLVLLDCCHAAGVGDPKNLHIEQGAFKSGLSEHYYEQLAQGKGRVIIASSRTDEVSLVTSDIQNSLFTYYLIEALHGKARTNQDGYIRVFDVFNYVSEEVPKRAAQHPIFKATDLENNFPIAFDQGSIPLPALKEMTDEQHSVAIDKRALRNAIVDAFSVDELPVLCADIEFALSGNDVPVKVNMDLVGGNDLVSKVLRLIGYLERRGCLPYLIEAVRIHRPGIF